MEDPYAYVRSVQEQFDRYHREIRYSNAYYDTLGLERPDGSDSDAALLEFCTGHLCFCNKKEVMGLGQAAHIRLHRTVRF